MDRACLPCTANLGRCCDLLGSVSGLPRSDNMAHRNPRIETGRTLEKDAANSALGCYRLSSLAAEFHENLNPLARCSLQTPKRPICFDERDFGLGFCHQ